MKEKESAAQDAFVVVILMACVFILVIDSVAITWFTTQWYGSSAITSLVLPENPVNYLNNQNFKTCNFNLSTWYITGNAQWGNLCDTSTNSIGEILQIPNTDIIFGYSWLLLRNIVPDSQGIIRNSYSINNSVLKPYVIALRYTGSTDQIEIRIDTDGFHIPNYVIPPLGFGPAIALNDQAFIPTGNLNPSQFPHADISTVYDNSKNSLNLVFNGNEYHVFNLKPDSNIFGLFGRYYGGVGSNTAGFVVENIASQNTIVNQQNESWLAQILNFLSALSSMLVFGVPTTLLPFEIQLIAIRLPEIGIIISIGILLLGTI